MSDSVPLRWFVYELRGLVMRLESASAASPEFLDGDFAESIRDQALELCESRVQFDELSPDEIRRLEPAETARSAKRILRRMLKSDKPFSVTFDDDARALRKCLNKLPPVDAPSGGKPGDNSTLIPKQRLFGWREILEALAMPNTDENTGRIKRLNESDCGPITAKPGRGNRPEVDRDDLLKWWEQRKDRLTELEQRDVDRIATIAEQSNYGRSETVVHGIGGHVKKRRGTDR